ncbi:outer membrane beta-barrel protein [Cellulophaga sp. F20128]|uniref:outer membrane beta-barrel protein n=1 Tax=Cellulophaga sp. F20128 TaxID=2926413 RepID=UPI001FF4F884|nr:outer membrane beta-barrel protein [Cellulophaga sp. F20128]MCK0155909.1 outer membrane beta-barrel protein [Cellulophaga sp. F20128]
MGKKNIDKLFQEKFQDFSQLPDQKVWERLETSLDEKKKDRKLIPIWWKLGGVAAVLAIVFFAVNPFEKTTDIPSVTDTEGVTPKIKVVPVTELDLQNKDGRFDKGEGALTDTDANKSDGEDAVKPPSSEDVNSERIQTKQKTATGIVSSQNKGKNLNTAELLVQGSKSTQEETAIASGSTVIEEGANQANSTVKKESKFLNNNLANSNKKALEDHKEEALATADTVHKKSIYDEIEASKEADAIATNRSNKWSVGASVAPVYFNSLNNGSPIDENFISNSKTGNVNLSYGVSVAYNVGKKLSIRSGLHKVDYGYNTNDVVFKSVFNPETNSIINSIDYDSNSESVVVENKKSSSLSDPGSTEFSAKSTSREGKMVQQFGYIEMPLEVNYALTDGKFGVNLIGGVSSLFLLDNSISLEADNLKTELGESNNINSLNFSTNVGVGLNYKFTPKVQLNIEPMFKYQLNTFSNTSGDFQPFTMGVYSGLSFKF